MPDIFFLKKFVHATSRTFTFCVETALAFFVSRLMQNLGSNWFLNNNFKNFQRAPVKNIENQWIPVFTGMTKLRRNRELVFSLTRPFFGRVCSWVPAFAGTTNLRLLALRLTLTF